MTQSKLATGHVVHGSVGQSNVFQGIIAGPDSHQVIVSTCSDLVSAKGVTAMRGAVQWLGQMSDTTLQHVPILTKEIQHGELQDAQREQLLQPRL